MCPTYREFRLIRSPTYRELTVFINIIKICRVSSFNKNKNTVYTNKYRFTDCATCPVCTLKVVNEFG